MEWSWLIESLCLYGGLELGLEMMLASGGPRFPVSHNELSSLGSVRAFVGEIARSSGELGPDTRHNEAFGWRRASRSSTLN